MLSKLPLYILPLFQFMFYNFVDLTEDRQKEVLVNCIIVSPSAHIFTKKSFTLESLYIS